jgi:hypothetical protein
MRKGLAREDNLKVLATAGLILADTMIFHEVLAKTNPKIKTLAQIKPASNTKKALEDEWTKILDINYVPVFRLALNLLENLPASITLDRQLRSLIDTAYDIAASYALLRHDLMGRLYHQLLLGKLVKYYATLYTSIPAARLLARLVVNLPSDLECSDVPPKFGEDPLRVVDFACGSGTLLSAVYKEVDAKHRVDSEKPDPSALHKYLVEDGLWGFDVLLHAAHLTTLTLFLHNPFSPVTRSKVYVLPMGVMGKPETAHLGSLDFLQSSKISPESRLIGGAIGVQKISVSGQEAEAEELPKFHVCIMNPPFTRSVGGNLLFGSLPKDERKRLQKELSKLLKSKCLSGIGQAGLGGSFTFLADAFLEEGGRLGLVLPKAALAGVSWRQIRERLLRNYHVEYILSSFEGPYNWNFSENTSLSEVLLVAQKVKKKKKGDYTIFVNFWSKPKSEIESIFVGSLLLDLYQSAKLYDVCNANASPYHLRLRGKKIGEVYSARFDNVEFGPYQLFAQAELNRVVMLLRQGTVYTPTEGIVGRVSLTALSNFVSKIGPDVKQVHNAFKRSRYSPTSAYHALWGHHSALIRTIEQEPNASLEPKKNDLARQAWKGSGKLLVVERARLSTYRVLTSVTTKEVLSNVWWPTTTNEVKIKDGKLSVDNVNKILSIWFNSVYGTLLLLSAAEVTEGAWVKFKKEPLSTLPVIDLSKITIDKARTLLDLYDEIHLQELKPLPEEFARPNVKKKIDDTFNQTLGIQAKLEELYKLLSQDPTITAQPLT